MAEGGQGSQAQGSVMRHVSREDSPGTGAISWENFSHWVCCACVVTFDLELGQAMEVRLGDAVATLLFTCRVA